MAATAPGGKKGGKKKKGKTLVLTEFLSASDATIFAPRKTDWAEESEDLTGNVSEEYAGANNAFRPAVDLSKLPSAPRASRAVELDMSKLPSAPPYTIFLGNLPYDVTPDDIRNFCKGLNVSNVRLPEDGGRMKGFAYVEFMDLEAFKDCLALDQQKIRNRAIRVDIAGGSKEGERQDRRGGFGADVGSDKTDGDWRRDATGPLPSRANGHPGGDRFDDRRGGDGFERSRVGFREHGDGSDRRLGSGPADTENSWRRAPDESAPVPPAHHDEPAAGGDRGYSNRRDDRFYGGDRAGDRAGFDRGDRGRYERMDRGGFGRREGFEHADRSSGRWGDDRAALPDRRSERFGDRGGRPDYGRGDHGGRFDYGRGDHGGRSDERGARFGDDRGGSYGEDRMGPERREQGPGEPEPSKVRAKLNLKPRSVEKPVDSPAPVHQSAIFGGARPVDTATREHEIEEKIERLHEQARYPGDGLRPADDRSARGVLSSKDPQRSSYRPEDPGDRYPPRDRRDYRDSREEYRTYDDGDRGVDEHSEEDGGGSSWRDEPVRHGRPRVMRPDLVSEAEKAPRERTVSAGSAGSRDDMAVLKKSLSRESKEDEPEVAGSRKGESKAEGRGRGGARGGVGRGRGGSPEDKRLKKKRDVPAALPKYEEPSAPVFGTTSKFAALGLADDENVQIQESDSDHGEGFE